MTEHPLFNTGGCSLTFVSEEVEAGRTGKKLSAAPRQGWFLRLRMAAAVSAKTQQAQRQQNWLKGWVGRQAFINLRVWEGLKNKNGTSVWLDERWCRPAIVNYKLPVSQPAQGVAGSSLGKCYGPVAVFCLTFEILLLGKEFLIQLSLVLGLAQKAKAIQGIRSSFWVATWITDIS